jgi:hypothetical protein
MKRWHNRQRTCCMESLLKPVTLSPDVDRVLGEIRAGSDNALMARGRPRARTPHAPVPRPRSAQSPQGKAEGRSANDECRTEPAESASSAVDRSGSEQSVESVKSVDVRSGWETRPTPFWFLTLRSCVLLPGSSFLGGEVGTLPNFPRIRRESGACNRIGPRRGIADFRL